MNTNERTETTAPAFFDYDGIKEHSLTRHIIRLAERPAPFAHPRYGKTLCGRYMDFTNSRHRDGGPDECPACARAAGR